MKYTKKMICAVLAGAATMAGAAEPPAADVRDRAVMLYVSKSFGSLQRQNRTPLAFGLRLQQSSPFASNLTVPLLDMRYSLGGRKTLLAGGAVALDSGSMEGSSDEDSFKEPWFWVIFGTLTLGTLCVTNTFVCEEKRRRESTSESQGLGR
jgi:hypothetical protein